MKTMYVYHYDEETKEFDYPDINTFKELYRKFYCYSIIAINI